MSTVDKAFADNLARNDGYFNGDFDNSLGDNPRCVKIIEYTNAWGGIAYGAVFETDRDKERYSYATDYILSPRVYWVASTGGATSAQRYAGELL